MIALVSKKRATSVLEVTLMLVGVFGEKL